MKSFCERLKDLRKENRLTTNALGNILNISGSTNTRLENGIIVPSIDHLYNIAVYFRVSSDYLIGLSDY